MKNTTFLSLCSVFFIGLIAFLVVFPDCSFATGTGGGMPWDTPLDNLKTALTGKVAGMIILVALIGAGSVLIFGGELNSFVRTLLLVVVVGATIAGAGSIADKFLPSGTEISNLPQIIQYHKMC